MECNDEDSDGHVVVHQDVDQYHQRPGGIAKPIAPRKQRGDACSTFPLYLVEVEEALFSHQATDW